MGGLVQERQMKIVLVGAGNLATNLGKALKRVGHEIVQVYSRTEESASALAEVLQCPYTTTTADVVDGGDIYIICVKDSALPNVAEGLVDGHPDRFIVHTAGSMPMDALPSQRRGVFYPMQTFSKQREVDFRDIPCFVEALQDGDLQMLMQFAASVSDKVYELSSDNRKYLHLAAVFCCNFANRCFAIGEELLKEHGGVPFSVMLPLIDETARKLHTLSPREAQTGPAVRWDTNVIDKQMALLSAEPDLKDIYERLSKSIHDDKLRLEKD